MPVIIYILFVSLLVTAGIFDIKTRKIPDLIPIALIVTGIIRILLISAKSSFVSVSLPDVADAVLGLAVGGLPMLIIALIKKQSIGGGDVKLAASAGFVLGFSDASVTLLLALIVLLVYSKIYIRIKRLPGHTAFPFAPFYGAAGMLIGILSIVSTFVSTHSVRFI